MKAYDVEKNFFNSFFKQSVYPLRKKMLDWKVNKNLIVSLMTFLYIDTEFVAKGLNHTSSYNILLSLASDFIKNLDEKSYEDAVDEYKSYLPSFEEFNLNTCDSISLITSSDLLFLLYFINKILIRKYNEERSKESIEFFNKLKIILEPYYLKIINRENHSLKLKETVAAVFILYNFIKFISNEEMDTKFDMVFSFNGGNTLLNLSKENPFVTNINDINYDDDSENIQINITTLITLSYSEVNMNDNYMIKNPINVFPGIGIDYKEDNINNFIHYYLTDTAPRPEEIFATLDSYNNKSIKKIAGFTEKVKNNIDDFFKHYSTKTLNELMINITIDSNIPGLNTPTYMFMSEQVSQQFSYFMNFFTDKFNTAYPMYYEWLKDVYKLNTKMFYDDDYVDSIKIDPKAISYYIIYRTYGQIVIYNNYVKMYQNIIMSIQNASISLMSELIKKVKIYNTEINDLTSLLKTYEKQNKELKYKSDRQEEKLDEQEKSLNKAQENLKKALSELEILKKENANKQNLSQEVNNDSESVDKDFYLMVDYLLDKKILIVGGLTKQIQKLQSYLKNITWLSGEENSHYYTLKKIATNYKYIFVDSKHVSHSIFDLLQSRNVPFNYISSTNSKLLISEIYTAIKNMEEEKE